MRKRGRRSVRGLGALLGVLAVACGPNPVTVLTGLEIVVAEGDEQYGTAGQVLSTPLRAVVRTVSTLTPQPDVRVVWEVVQGDASLVGAGIVTTDETGSVDVRVQLGGAPSDVVVRATVVEQSSATVSFDLHAVEPLELSSVTPGSAAAGDTVTLTGSNFSPVTEQNVVLFSGVRGRVVSASSSELAVEVPSCLPSRVVELSTQLGTVASDSLTFVVTGGGVLTELAVGSWRDVDDAGGFACHALGGAGGAEYLALVYSASTVGAAMHPYQLSALSSLPQPAVARPPPVALLPGAAPTVTLGPQAALDRRLRTLEGELLGAPEGPARADAHTTGARSTDAASAEGPTAVPTVGDSRSFHVYCGLGCFTDVTAVAEYVGAEAAIFVDVNAPADGFEVSDLELFAGWFDDAIHPEVTSTFGVPSDLDQNERVIILFTPVVNELTEPGAAGYVGGFFYGNDLLPENTSSNRGEVFYALVPDPLGIHSDPRTKTQVLSAVPAVLAHEFQHMVHFNERYLELDAGQAALWLSEGLAQMAEELVARHFDGLVQPQLAEIFRAGTRARARRYLADTDDVSLIVATGQGSLTERGAGFLHVLYLSDQEGTDVLGRLTRTTRKGVANVEAEMGRSWPDILSDWWSAIYTDDLPGPWSRPLVYPEVDLWDYVGTPFPLSPTPIGPGDATRTGLLWSSSVAYYLVTPDEQGSVTLRLGGEAGGVSSSQAALRLRILRLS